MPTSQFDNDPLLYKQVFDNAVVGICFMVGRRFVQVNRRMEEMLGYAPGALLGEPVRRVYARRQDYEEVGEIVARVPHENFYLHERPLLTRDGGMLWCLIGGRWLTPDDSESASVWVVQDISAKKHAEDQLARANQRLEQRIESRTRNLQKTNAALKLEVERRRDTERAMIESREKYRVLIRNIPLGIVVTDPDGGIVEINPTMQLWFGADEAGSFAALAAQLRCRVLGAEADSSLLDVILTRAASRRADHQTVLWRAGSGETLWFDVVGVRVPVRGLGAAVVFADRTEQRRARDRELAQQQQLAHAMRRSLMGEFASALAHELGQPLNASLSYAAGLERRFGEELRALPEATEALHAIQRQLRQAGDIIRNVRSFVTRHRPGDEPVDLLALTYSTLELLQLQLREQSTRVEVKAAAAVPSVSGNRVELQQVLVNLIVNAIEAMRGAETAKPEIRIGIAKAPGGKLAITVADNGPGVPPERRGQLFEPYSTTKRDGLGMGLMMCRNIVEAHGGTLAFDARARHGAAFRFTLQAARHDQSADHG
ncbi:MAG: hypothetical protein NVS9B10_26070 [Nevskia sp.]